MPDVIQAKDLYRFHEVHGEKVPILRNINLAVTEGEFLTIMGPSGSGKSTLLHILCGLDVPSAGQVLLGGTNLATADEGTRTRVRRQNIGFVFQFFNLIPDLTVEENVVLPLLIAGEDTRAHVERIDQLLESLGLATLRSRLPHKLSGGEMQRVSIARALAARPPVLMADEPTGNLSTKAGEEIIALLREVQKRFQTTVVLVTHNPRDAASGDRVLFLKDGELSPRVTLKGPDLRAADVFRCLEELGI
jgi:putative ABC transport system ATP-binding protein